MQNVCDILFIFDKSNIFVVGENVDIFHDVGVETQQPKSVSLAVQPYR